MRAAATPTAVRLTGTDAFWEGAEGRVFGRGALKRGRSVSQGARRARLGMLRGLPPRSAGGGAFQREGFHREILLWREAA